ncbi:hypothetical protein AZSI13_28360 [Azospira sp. I13]|uniref:PqiC family protein n=1 Tax=Azospira sp. I13 TaxID=1765050 RepID=UPI000D405968|nr:PqiC family protein [Azospira sp. I13]GBG03509.1 hypothetical protein AZSI13_28360 [Azospira sp. I13]
MPHFLRVLSALFAALLLGACGTTPKAQHYILDDGTTAPGPNAHPSVLLLTATLPELLDRPQLVLRGSQNQITFSEQQRWAEPLRVGIPRAMAADLGRALASAQVAALPAGAPLFDADFRLTLHVQRLEAQPGNGVDLDMLWVLQPREGKEIRGRSQIHEKLEEPSFPAAVAAQRRALGRASSEIAAAIRQQAPAAPQSR